MPLISKSESSAPWLFLNILGLDAALIAVVWQELFAKQLHVLLNWPERITIFSLVWAIYLLDRWMDGRRLAKQPLETQQHAPRRHQSAMRHAAMHLTAAFILLLLSSFLAVFHLPRIIIFDAAPIALICCLYFLWINTRRNASPQMFKKSLVVSSVFTAGIACAPLAITLLRPLDLLPLLLTVWLTMNANSFAIARAEARLTRQTNEEKFLNPQKWIFSGILAAGIFTFLQGEPSILPIACLVSLFLLFGITLIRQHLSPETNTSAFEAALILPAFLLFFY
ncbi:MAG: hypothetical protein ACK5NG_00025 [Chthoniobacterales bacterium]